MEFMNIVRAKVKPEHLDEYMKLNEEFPIYDGMLSSKLIKTGDYTFCYVGTWESEDALVIARPALIGNLDKMRDFLEEISPELGVTDPRSGNIIMEWK